MRSVFVLLILGFNFALALPISEGRVSKSSSSTTNPSFKGDRHTFYAGFDSYSRGLMKTTTAGNGAKDTKSPAQYPFNVNYRFKLTEKSRLWLQSAYTLFPKRGFDGVVDETHLLVKLPYSQSIGNSNFDWKVGLVYHQIHLAGSGGSVLISNGSGASEFFVPAENRSTSVVAPEFGAIFEVKKLLVQSSLIVEAPFNSYARTFSLMIGISYNLGGF